MVVIQKILMRFYLFLFVDICFYKSHEFSDYSFAHYYETEYNNQH